MPLALLTKGGANRTIVKDTFEELLRHKLYDLLPIGQTIAGWLLKGVDLEWLKKEYRNMLDLFKDSPAYQWMTEEALERGRQEERLKALEAFQRTVVALVDKRFPVLADFAREKVQTIEDQERLQRAILDVSLSKNIAEVLRALDKLSADSAQEK